MVVVVVEGKFPDGFLLFLSQIGEQAFGKVFTVAGIVLGLTSVIGIFTDRKTKALPEPAGVASASVAR